MNRAVTLATLLAGSAGPAFAGGGGNSPPVCDAGPLQMIECNGSTTMVQLDGTGSFDPDGDPLTYSWSVVDPGNGLGCPGGTFDDPTSATPVLSFPFVTCLEECGEVRLTVSDGQSSSTCTTAIVASDTLAPAITCAADVLELWTTGYPMQADPTNTGFATGMDACTPVLSVTFTDLSVVPGIPPSGIEQVVTREWRVEDSCGNFDTCVQTITFVGPSFFADSTAAIDALPGDCLGALSLGEDRLFLVNVFGQDGLDASQVNLRSVRMERVDGVGEPVRALYRTVGDAGSPAPVLCPDLSPDGLADAVLRFSVPEAVHRLQLDQLAPDSVIAVRVTGRLADGTRFTGRDVLRIQP